MGYFFITLVLGYVRGIQVNMPIIHTYIVMVTFIEVLGNKLKKNTYVNSFGEPRSEIERFGIYISYKQTLHRVNVSFEQLVKRKH